MSCEDHHLGMNYVQVKPGKEPEMKSWCFTCRKYPVLRQVALGAESEPPVKAAAKRTPRSTNGVRSS